MPRRRVPARMIFPDPRTADADGLVAYGGDLHPERVLAAYAQGIFPWPHDARWPLLWFSPDPRVVLLPAQIHVSHSLRKTLHKQTFTIRYDTAFADVIRHCAAVPRPGQHGTWITDQMIDAYCTLHTLGFAHSVEAWWEETLVGGLYGISLGAAFFGESMFARRPDASKVALVSLARQLHAWEFHFIDCQMPTPHLASLGAVPWRRADFLQALARALDLPTRRGPWTLAAVPTPAAP